MINLIICLSFGTMTRGKGIAQRIYHLYKKKARRDADTISSGRKKK